MKLATETALLSAVVVFGASGAWIGAAGKARRDAESPAAAADRLRPAAPPRSAPLEPFVQRGVAWLIRAQHPNGGWGAGSHANQQLRDPHKVVTDPATTAFVAMALVRTGSTPESGPHREALARATTHLLEVVEQAGEAGPRITGLEGTQIQAKLGPIVDTAMTSHYFSRILPALKASPLRSRVDAALDRCLRKLQGSQLPDGSWGVGRGWAPVLQSSLSMSALETAKAAGKAVDAAKLAKARQYQKDNYDAASGRAKAEAAAGVELYAFSSAQRAAAAETAEAIRIAGGVSGGVAGGAVGAAPLVSEDRLKQAGLDERKAKTLNDAYVANATQLRRIADEELLSGFGSNGGEEYLSYLQTSESLIITGSQEWDGWKSRMSARLAKIQSPDGSWTGHHCITSPVFCTAAVLQTLTADRDALELRQIAQRD